MVVRNLKTASGKQKRAETVGNDSPHIASNPFARLEFCLFKEICAVDPESDPGTRLVSTGLAQLRAPSFERSPNVKPEAECVTFQGLYEAEIDSDTKTACPQAECRQAITAVGEARSSGRWVRVALLVTSHVNRPLGSGTIWGLAKVGGGHRFLVALAS